MGRKAVRPRLTRVRLERPVTFLQRKSDERPDGIDPAGADENEPGGAGLAVLQHVERAHEVVVEELPAPAFAIDAREYAGIGRAVDHPVRVGQRAHVGLRSDVALEHANAPALQCFNVGLGPAAAQIVDAKNF